MPATQIARQPDSAERFATKSLCGLAGGHLPNLRRGPLRPVADERQYVLPHGQIWASLDQLASEGQKIVVAELEPGLLEMYAVPRCHP